MNEIANYTFLPWLRQGLASQISGQSGSRATVTVDLSLSGDNVDGGEDNRPPIHQDVEIYGPGDIVGIDQSSIIKVEPRNWITNFEANYLPYIEFYDEDFPWRYSPVTPNGHRLHPWITLVVLRETEFTEGKNIKNRPLPYINLDGAAKLPPSDQLWAWSHVHVNKNIIGMAFTTDDATEVESKLRSALLVNPDLAYARIVCPRRLEPNVAYHAFLVPVFETGVRACNGEDPAGAASHDALAWTDAVRPAALPYYYRWYFRTGVVGDFEYLVRLLKPQPVDRRVGLRDMDVQRPGANIRGIIDDPAAPDEQKLGGILKLGGALRIPDAYYDEDELAVVEKYRSWPTLAGYPHPFQQDLSAFINLSDSYQEKKAEVANSESGINELEPADDPDTEYDIRQNPDPLITAPLYARWHALTQRLLKARDNTTDLDPNDNWVHELNLDPQWRVPAGFGTKIVQENQERYMKAAWDQVGEVLESNKRIRAGQLARQTSWVWYESHIKPVADRYTGKWLTFSAPLHRRVLHQGVTISHQIDRSRVPRAVLSPPMRKLMRPRGRLMKRLPFTAEVTADNLIARLNEGDVSAAPPREVPELNTVQDIADTMMPVDLPKFLVDLLKRHPWIRWIPLLLALIVILLVLLLPMSAVLLGAGTLIVGGLVYLYRRLSAAARRIELANSVLEENQTPQAVNALPQSLDFRISTPDEGFTPAIGTGPDSAEAVRFKQALRDVNLMLQESARVGAKQIRPTLDLTGIGSAVFTRLDPQVTIPNWVWGGVLIPGRIRDQLTEDFAEAMAYPEIDDAMYKPLADHSAELFLPNINFIAENSISLLETNQKFIESYMVGLNHEFARELLWREYPTDQRGSYFRQFWEAQGYHDNEQLSAEALKEKLRDIPPIHRWLKHSKLGDHDHRELPGENEEEVVLVIRGELLKRYPNAIIYAHRAVWRDDTKDGNPILDMNSGQTIDLTKERDLRPLSAAEEANPPRTIVKTPLYEAKVEPDIYFFGFDLTVCEAQGGTGREDLPVEARCVEEGIQWHDPGWFFVIKERPGEIGMGLDIPDEEVEVNDVKVWNDLSWSHVTPPVADGEFLQISNATQAIVLQPLDLPAEQEKAEQQSEDAAVEWHKDMSAADLAYILYQVPVLVAVHASEMLPQE
ncbi:MAG: hypothetical protein H0T47_20975 [Planctomycetaceae bacterium]|nr:hypothetical protein [Planctomycetaceae bacterium]